jgi:hypothetical protein
VVNWSVWSLHGFALWSTLSKRGNQNPYIEEEQTIQWSKEKVQKDKQRSTKHTHKAEDRVTRTPLKTEGILLDVIIILQSGPGWLSELGSWIT